MAVAGDPHVEEVRVAMALNGGVSLAVWMGGCAVELDCAQRAHAGTEPLYPPGIESEDDAGRAAPDRSTYATLCEAFGRRLVIDIMTGASAGGINGALLAAAARYRRRLHPTFIRKKWIALGDFEQILQPLSEANPHAIMQGAVFTQGLREAFDELTSEAIQDDTTLTSLPPEQSATIEESDVKLDVTTTDVTGESQQFVDTWGNVLLAREHRARFRFRKRADFTGENLSIAARASASFPVAFEPQYVSGGPLQRLAGFSEPRFTIDGGLLDNAPIQPAIDLIPQRPAAGEVVRFLCYVNADPAEPKGLPTGPDDAPTISEVLGYIVNLPRDAPFVDQLTAIERAVNRGARNAEVAAPLIGLSEVCLLETARSLLPAYMTRRRSASTVIEEPDACGPDLSLDPPYAAEQWQWGRGASERILYLLLDVMRLAISRAGDARESLLAARLGIYRQLEQIAAAAATLEARLSVEDTDPKIDAVGMFNHCAFVHLRTATASVYAVADKLGWIPGPTSQLMATTLFGPVDLERDPELTDAAFTMFLRRALAIEVIRRAISTEDLPETGQQLRFAQLTPFCPCPILTSTPMRDSGPATPREKLTGRALGHFAGFYRRSWRANDFMWGRLDAAARIVDLLVDPERAATKPGLPLVWVVLAERLLPDDIGAEQLWLIVEALEDCTLPAAVAGMQGLPAEGAPDYLSSLRDVLRDTMYSDLYESTATGKFTRIVCTRAAQLEILRHEFPTLVLESKADTKVGAGAPDLPIPNTGGKDTILELRSASETLPEMLGAQSENEFTSALAMRTASHTGLVTIAALRTAGVPLTGLLSPARTPLLSIGGVVASKIYFRLLVAYAFCAAALFLTARIVSTNPGETTPLDRAAALALIVFGVAVLTVLGFLTVPAVRAKSSRGTTRWIEVGCGLVLAAAGGAGAILCALFWANFGVGAIIAAPGVVPLDQWLSLAVITLALGMTVYRVPLIGSFLDAVIRQPWGGNLAGILVLAVCSCLVISSIRRLLTTLPTPVTSADPWIICSVAAAALALPAALVYVIWRYRA